MLKDYLSNFDPHRRGLTPATPLRSTPPSRHFASMKVPLEGGDYTMDHTCSATSQRRGAQSRRYLQALKLRLRLNGIASIGLPLPERPRRMHRTTYERLSRRLERLEQPLRKQALYVTRN